MQKCDLLNSEINQVVDKTHWYPQNRKQEAIGAFKTIAASSLGCITIMGVISLLEDGGTLGRVRCTLIAGGVLTVPVGGGVTLLYHRSTTRPEKEHRVVLQAMAISDDDTGRYANWTSPLHREIAEKAVAFARQLSPMQLLHDRVRTTHAVDNPLPWMTRVTHELWGPVAVGASFGVLIAALLLSANVALGGPLDRDILRFGAVIAGELGLIGSLFGTTAYLYMVKDRRISSETIDLLDLVEARGDVRAQFNAFYANRNGDPMKQRVETLLVESARMT